MPYDLISDHVAMLTLDDGERYNKLSDGPLLRQATEGLEQVRDDPEIRVLVITGAGDIFSAGGDIRAMHERTGTFAGGPAQIREAYKAGIHRLCRAVHALEIPTIAAINGPAYGAGCDLAMMCDIRIGSANMLLAENFVRLGLISGDGGSWFLPRVAGLSRAAEMTFTGRPVDAQTALAWGLVSSVTAPEDLIDEARRIADTIAEAAPLAVRNAKRLLRRSLHTTLDEALDDAAGTQAIMHSTDDHREAVAAFLEKRKPSFSGR